MGEDVAETVRRALREAPVGLKELAAESGLSYDVVRSWRSGRRRPHPESARRLARGLRTRAALLKGLAEAVERAAGPSS